MSIGRTTALRAPAFISEVVTTRRIPLRQMRCSAPAERPQAPSFGKVQVILGQKRYAITVSEAVFKLGRLADNHVIVDVEQDRYADLLGRWISRHHLEFWRDGQEKLWVRDISSNGTTLDGTCLFRAERELAAPRTLLQFGGKPRPDQLSCPLPEIWVQQNSSSELTLEIIPSNQYVPLRSFYLTKFLDLLFRRKLDRKPICLLQTSPTQVGLLQRYWQF